jgi:hypothetical protein
MQITGTLPKPKKIGSIKNGKVNYPQDQNFFHSSDMRPEVRPQRSLIIQVRDRVKYIKELTDKDHLGVKRPTWNTSSFAGDKAQESHA